MTVQSILSERQAIYGDYAKVARTSQSLKQVLELGDSWDSLPDVDRESIHMICNKLARWVNGKPHPDTPLDIAGYATLAIPGDQR